MTRAKSGSGQGVGSGSFWTRTGQAGLLSSQLVVRVGEVPRTSSFISRVSLVRSQPPLFDGRPRKRMTCGAFLFESTRSKTADLLSDRRQSSYDSLADERIACRAR